MNPTDTQSKNAIPLPALDGAVELFLRQKDGPWTMAEEAKRDATLQDSGQTRVFRQVEQAWQAMGDCADSPEIMVLREQALARARRAQIRRWRLPMSVAFRRRLVAAVMAGIVILAGVIWQVSPYGPRAGAYGTDLGEQKLVELSDRSSVVLDASTRLRVRYSQDARIVEILDGQAQFSVTKDSARPFKVVAGDHIIVALGTVFTVEYVNKEVQVAMLEGRVAVFAPQAPRSPEQQPIELAKGESLRVRSGGHMRVNPQADLSAATAWRQGHVIFHDEPLAEAVRRLNRYSRVQIHIKDPELSKLTISGFFDAGDTRAFSNALQSYLPVTAQYPDSDSIELWMK